MVNLYVIHRNLLKLQWGRAFSSAEIVIEKQGEHSKNWLQWGRAFSSAEICNNFFIFIFKIIWLQWGRAFSSAEIFHIANFSYLACPASMGPRFFKRGNQKNKTLCKIE